MSSRMRVTKGHSNNRRAHHALTAARLCACFNCGANHERHKVCLECGMYRGKQVMKIKTKKNLVTKAENIKEVSEKKSEKTATKETVLEKSEKK